MAEWQRILCVIAVFNLGLSLASDSMVISLSEATVNDEASKVAPNESLRKPTVNSLRIDSSIQHRYAKTRVISRLANPSNVSQEVVFDMVLPKKAFITSFLMEIKGKLYKAYIKEKEEAAKVYQEAVQAGQTAAHVEVTARDSNHFGISVNIEANGKVKFLLNYEELLSRNLGKYNHVVNLNPGQLVNDLEVNVYIQEAVNITDVYVPELRVTNEISEEKEKENTVAKITRPDSKRVHVSYRPSAAEQTKYAPSYGGQLVVQYDVDHSSGSQILVNDGYFVHFFSPQNLQPLRKLAVFVLDVSGSMYGRKIEQLKDAMNTILDNLGKDDYFNIIDFSHGVTVHNLENGANSPVVKPQYDFDYYGESTTASPTTARKIDFPSAYPNTETFINRTKEVINKMEAAGGTNIHDALKTALIVAQSGVQQIRLNERNKKGAEPIEPIIIFLTDGDPTVGVTSHQRIFTTTKENNYFKTPIFSLGFGSSADMKFLRRISLGNHAFARSIYEAADAASQLRNFYRQVASPLLANVTFNYLNGQVVEGSLTKEKFPTLFLGSELVVAGKLDSNSISGSVNATSSKGNEAFSANHVILPKPVTSIEDFDESDEDSKEDNSKSDDEENDHGKKGKIGKKNTLERLWAYMTVQDKIDLYDVLDAESESEKAKAVKRNATELALKFKFVTPFTSLVVVKPNNSQEVTSAKEESVGGQQSYLSASHSALPNRLYVMKAPVRPPSFSGFGGAPGGWAHSAVMPLSASGPSNIFMSMSSMNSMSVQRIISNAESTTRQPESTTMAPLLIQPKPSWFNSALSEDNSTLKLPFGPDNATVEYKWREEDALYDAEFYENCSLPESPAIGNSTTPQTHEYKCKHLLHCSTFKTLTNLEEYKKYFCAISGEKAFAGMCCPENDSSSSIQLAETTTAINPPVPSN